MNKRSLTFLSIFLGILIILGFAAYDDHGRSLVMESPRDSVLVFEASGGGVVSSSAAVLRGVVLRNANASGYVYIYDNASAGSGTKVLIYGKATDEDGDGVTGMNIACANGIYATIGNGADVTVTYQTF